jgi:hypothetical protein
MKRSRTKSRPKRRPDPSRSESRTDVDGTASAARPPGTSEHGRGRKRNLGRERVVQEAGEGSGREPAERA